MQPMILLGAKMSKGSFEGRAYDSTKLYIQTEMSQSAEQAGYACAEYTWGDSTNFAKVKDLQYPCPVLVQTQIVTNGKTVKSIITDLKPQTDKQAPKQAS